MIKKLLWWLVNTFEIKTKPSEPLREPPVAPEDNPPPKTPYFTSNLPFMEQLMRDYVIPGLKEYRRTHNFYPPTEARFLKKILHKPQGISDENWTTVLKRVGEEIEKLEREGK